MAYQQIQTASETPLDGAPLIEKLLRAKVLGLSQGVLITDNFISDVENFANRNALSRLHPEVESVSEACPRCLKAFMKMKASEHGLTEKAKEIVKQIVQDETGHNGYYLDEGKVKPVQS